MDSAQWPVVLLTAAITTVTAPACRSMSPRQPRDGARLAEVRLAGFDVLPAGDRADLRTRLPLVPGKPLSQAALEASARIAVEALQNRGYPYARVRLAEEPAGAGLTAVVVQAEPGTPGFFGRVEIAGNRHVDAEIIRRRFAFHPGEPFSRRAIEETQRAIGALGLFKSVAVEIEQADRQPVDVPILVTVEERSPWRWNVSVGYADSERVSLEAQVRHMNFLGGARRLELTGRVSAIDRLAQAGFVQPQLWRPGVSLSLQATSWSIDDPVVHGLSRGGRAALTRAWSPRASITVAYAASLERGRSPGGLEAMTGLQDGTLNAWSSVLAHRTPGADRPAPSGRAVTFVVEQAGGWMPGTFSYASAAGDARFYRSFAGDRATVAARVEYGAIRPAAAEADVPLLKRLFLGGSTRMRGWSRFELSPLSPSGEPVGGRSLLSSSLELRGRFSRWLGGALFLDAGHVWRTARSTRLADLQYDAGPGVRLDTPFGLVRLDAAYQLTPVDGLRIGGEPRTRRWRIVVDLGQAF